MSSYSYQVALQSLKEIHEMPEAWTPEAFLGLLEHIEFEDPAAVLSEELKEMTSLALSDFEPEEAAVKVLEYRFGDALNKGQCQNLAQELKEDRLWEEYSDLKMHEELFNVSCILYWTFPKLFSTPDIASISLKVTAANKNSRANIVHPTASFLARLLNDGMSENNIMNRLYSERIESNDFSEAEHIIWSFWTSNYSESDNSVTIHIITSWNWVLKLKGVTGYESTAYADGQL